MRATRRRHGGARRGAGPRPERRRTGGNPPRSGERYGPGRLRALYEIGKVLASSDVALDRTVPKLLAITSRELPLRSAVIVVKAPDSPTISAWHSADASPADRRAAEERAMKSFALLTRGPSPGIERPAAAEPAASPERGRFVSLPLVVQDRPIFGSIHLAGSVPFDERDVECIGAIVNQFAVALDRYQAHLREVALREQAEELNKFKTGLVSVVSHEFGNSLTVMKIAVSILEEKLPPRTLKETGPFLRMVKINIEALNRAVQNLLSRTRLEAGKLAIDFKATDAAKILRHALDGMALLSATKSLQVSLSLPEGLRPVRADEPSLTLVISNLLSNAIKYTPENGRIVLGAAEEASRPGFYRLYVQDSGIGVAEEDRAKILGGHFRSESGKKMTAKGYGVGLSLAQEIVEAHGSTIEIEGGPDKGSRFSFLLPFAA